MIYKANWRDEGRQPHVSHVKRRQRYAFYDEQRCQRSPMDYPLEFGGHYDASCTIDEFNNSLVKAKCNRRTNCWRNLQSLNDVLIEALQKFLFIDNGKRDHFKFRFFVFRTKS